MKTTTSTPVTINDLVNKYQWTYARGFGITEFDQGIFEIQKVDSRNVFESDGEAAEAAVRAGIPIIPVEELPENFDRKYFGWIDTPDNRKAIEEYCKK